MTYSIIWWVISMETLIKNFRIEMKRGIMTLLVLHHLRKETYGYLLLQDLSAYDIPIEAGTLYPLLRRLESQGLLDSDWDTSESRARKYYCLNEKGWHVYEQLVNEWCEIESNIGKILKEDNK